MLLAAGGQQHPDLSSIRKFPSSLSSPFRRRPGTHLPFTKAPSSTVANPASGGPGVFGEKVTVTPLPTAKNSSGPVAMKMAAAGGGGSFGGGTPGILGWA